MHSSECGSIKSKGTVWYSLNVSKVTNHAYIQIHFFWHSGLSSVATLLDDCAHTHTDVYIYICTCMRVKMHNEFFFGCMRLLYWFRIILVYVCVYIYIYLYMHKSVYARFHWHLLDYWVYYYPIYSNMTIYDNLGMNIFWCTVHDPCGWR